MPPIRSAASPIIAISAALWLTGCSTLLSPPAAPPGAPTIAATAAPAAVVADDLWKRIRDGMQIVPNGGDRLASGELAAAVAKQLRWYQNNPSYLAAVFERAEPFIFDVVEQLESAGLPLELALLPVVESTYDPLAYSNSHAVGLWQFIPSTARAFGLERNDGYEGRRDSVAATAAAVRFLSYLHGQFDGEWLLALAAYNSGEGNVRRAVASNLAAGGDGQFWALQLPRETRNYVPQLLALAELVATPEHYAVELPELPNRPFFTAIAVNAPVDLTIAQRVSKTDRELFTRLNAAFRRSVTPADGATILLPTANAAALEHFLATTPPTLWAPYREVLVAWGDTLSELAERHDSTVAELKAANRLSSSQLRVGQRLVVPPRGKLTSAAAELPRGHQIYLVEPGDSLWELAGRFSTSVAQLRKLNQLSGDTLRPGSRLVVPATAALSAPADPAQPSVRKVNYQVKSGDSLSRIAAHFAVRTAQIVSWNQLDTGRHLQPGQRLTIYVNPLEI